jgi:hypothetical protein
MNKLQWCPSLANSLGNVPQTSASPPVFAKGIASDAAMMICMMNQLSLSEVETEDSTNVIEIRSIEDVVNHHEAPVNTHLGHFAQF